MQYIVISVKLTRIFSLNLLVEVKNLAKILVPQKKGGKLYTLTLIS